MDIGAKKSQLMPELPVRNQPPHAGLLGLLFDRPLICLPGAAAAIGAVLWLNPAAGLVAIAAAALTGLLVYHAAVQRVVQALDPSELFGGGGTSDLELPLKSASAELERQRNAAQMAEDWSDLLTNTIAASIIIRNRDNRTVFCSPFTQVLTGYEIADFMGHSGDYMRELVVADDIDRYDRAQKVSLLGEDTIVRCRIRHRSGLKLWLETRLVPVCNDEGEAISVMAITIDVTETLNYQRQIEEHNRDLADFTYMVSHDLKAPVFTIKGMAQVLHEDYGQALGDAGNDLIKYIIDAGDRLEQLIKSVIEYSALSIRGGEMAPVALNGVLTKVLADQTSQIKESQAVIEVAQDLPTVQGDEIRLYQVFSNLVGNAIKYRRRDVQPRISVTAIRNGDGSVMVMVKDNGLGVPKDKLDLVFRPYQRAHGNQVEGSGIGLACVKKIIDRLGGSVSVESAVGEGSTFIVTFPAILPPPQAIPPDLQKAFEI